LRSQVALWLLGLSLLAAAVLWLVERVFAVQPGSGAPVGHVVRTDRHLATWIQTLEPYLPSLHRNGGDDRFSLSVLLVPLAGGEPQLVRVHRGCRAQDGLHAQILGSDGQHLWVQALEISAIDLRTLAVRTAQSAPAGLRGAPTGRMLPRPAEHLLAGYRTGERWIGLHAAGELARDYAVGRFVRDLAPAAEGRHERRFCVGQLEPAGASLLHRIAALEPVGAGAFAQGALLRAAPGAGPLHLAGPEGVLVVAARDLGLAATLRVVRLDEAGQVVWQVDTGLDHFRLEQILGGEALTAFVGTRPAVPGRVPEPIVALVDHATGSLAVHSLWR
jgi:hypothetical protein